MPKITFLAASVPLTKTVEQTPVGLIKHPYPHVKDFTSHTEEVKNLSDFCRTLIDHQALGHCLLKGTIHKQLKNEPRAGATSSEAPTYWVCFDLDKAPFKTPDEFMKAVKLENVSYIVQYSCSHGLPDTVGLNCHIFCFLSHPLPAPQLKSWLMYINLKNPVFTAALRLSRTGIALSYSLDITTCQNDKLLYIAPPIFRGMKDPVKDRIQYCARKNDTLDVKTIALHQPEVLRKLATDFRNEKRALASMPSLRSSTTTVGEYEVQNKPGEMVITGGPKEERGFVYFNLNGSNNWSYFHPVDNYELLHNFKGEPFLRIKEALPDYYRQKVADTKAQQQSPTEEGDLLLAFCDRRTANYWCGTWNAAQRKLELYPAKTVVQLAHFKLSHNHIVPDFWPQWDIIFDPTSDTIVDQDARVINMYHPSEYYINAKRIKSPNLAGCPTIARIFEHAVGKGPVLEHFYNWLAVILQLRVKPITAWILHGTEGTGKGVIVSHILRPLFGSRHVASRRADELTSDFNGWLEFAQIGFIDEIEVNALAKGGAVEGKLKNFITEPTLSVRKMRTDSYEVPSYTGLIFSSNKPQMVVIPLGDRRYNVGQYQSEKLLLSIEDIYETIPDELQAFANYLVSRKADRALASTPLQTQDREDIMALSSTSADDTARYINEGNLEALWEAMQDEDLINELHGMTPFATYSNAYSALMKRCMAEYKEGKESKLTRDQLGLIFEHCVGGTPKTPNKLTSYLRHHGIKTARMKDNGLPNYGVSIKWICSNAFAESVKLRRVK